MSRNFISDIMKRTKRFLKKNYLQITSFLITFFLLAFLLTFNKDVYPFGKNTLLYSDLYEQYVPFFNYLRDTILSNNGLFNSFSFSLGNNFYGILTYFCISPFNLLFLFSNNATIPVFVSLIMFLKISLASTTMAILLKSKYKNSIFIIVFSVFYALMSYNFIYSSNIIWLDCVYLLPLIILGLERLITDNKPKMYLITLTLSIFCNYYISFSICLFLIIYYIYYILTNNFNKKTIKKSLIQFIKYSIIAVLLAAVILIPTVFNMLDGKATTAVADFSLNTKYDITQLGYKFMIGDNKMMLEDLPLITSSLIVLLLVLIYAFNYKITKKDKIVTISTVALLITITLFPFSDTIMHCLRVPNLFTYRYAFLISFFLILTAYKNFDMREHINKKNILLYVLLLGIIYYYLELYLGFKTILTSAIILIYFLTTIFVKDKKILFFTLFPVFVLELVINIKTNMDPLTMTTYSKYQSFFEYEQQIDEIKPKQSEFYRIEGKNKNTYDDAFALNYYGVRSFSPTITINTNKILKHYLGLPLKNSYAIDYAANTSFTNSFLGIKYLYLINDKTYFLEENESAFPVFFSINQDSEFVAGKTPIETQNNLYRYLSGNNEELFTKYTDIKIEQCKVSEDSNGLYIDSKNLCIIKTEKNDKDYEYYLEITSNDASLIPKYSQIETTALYGDNIIMDLRSDAKIYTHDGITYINSFNAYKMDKKALKELSQKLSNQQMIINFHNNDLVKGHINNQESNKIMFTTIPYDNGWHVKINNERVKTFKNLDSLLAFELPAGELNIEMYFIPKGFVSGVTISIFTLDLLLYIFFQRKKHRK